MPRPSPVRDAVLSLLSDLANHGRSLEELTALVRKRGLDADFSSVFRAAQRLERDGMARKVDLGDGKTRYEAPGDHHDHLVCDNCGRIEAVASCPVKTDTRLLEKRTGYRIRRHHLVFSGLCPQCADRG
ncbi:MAG: transcriptional repressor [Actinomycetota bacterium]|nr:transcriptional repressor [Actinomycetota bacterium]